MKKLTFVIVLMLAFVLSVSAASKVTGYVSDAGCGAKQGAKAASEKHAACAQKCIKGGAQAVLVTEEGKVYKIADQSKVTDHAGHKVTVTAEVDGDTLKNIEKVEM